MLRVIGGWLLLVAVLALVYDVTMAPQAGMAAAFTSLGKHWYDLSPQSLNLLQAAVERHVHPFLWDPVLLSVLKTPAWIVLSVLGLLLLALGRRRRRVNIFAN